MNWIEFFRTLVWLIAIIAIFGAVIALVSGGMDDNHKTLKLSVGVLCVIIAMLALSVIGGMNWGPPQ
jgi:Na+(H+)/acetate symporter ActP